MATYITLANYTAQGIANIADAPDRIDAAREQLGALGVEIKSFYLTMGVRHGCGRGGARQRHRGEGIDSLGGSRQREHHHNGRVDRARVQKPYLRNGLTLKAGPVNSVVGVEILDRSCVPSTLPQPCG